MTATIRSPLMDDMIVEHISRGGMLAELCREFGVDRGLVYDWINKDPDFAARMERARSLGADAIAEQALAIADQTELDTGDGGRPNKEWMQRSKLRVETRLKLLAKWHPKKYGEKLEIESTNRNANVPISDDPNEASRQYAAMLKR